jgi:hypothetical protein
VPLDEIESRYYLRFDVGDQPGLSSGDQLTSSLQLRAGVP